MPWGAGTPRGSPRAPSRAPWSRQGRALSGGLGGGVGLGGHRAGRQVQARSCQEPGRHGAGSHGLGAQAEMPRLPPAESRSTCTVRIPLMCSVDGRVPLGQVCIDAAAIRSPAVPCWPCTASTHSQDRRGACRGQPWCCVAPGEAGPGQGADGLLHQAAGLPRGGAPPTPAMPPRPGPLLARGTGRLQGLRGAPAPPHRGQGTTDWGTSWP